MKDTLAPSSPSHRPVSDEQRALIKRSIQTRLAIGHLCAIIAVSTLVNASFRPASALAPNAVVLLLCCIPLRTVLSLSEYITQPATQSGIQLALRASVLFSSNAIHVLATKASPPRLLSLIACSAIDVSASWLQMADNAKTPSLRPSALLFSLIYSVADVYLAAISAGVQPIINTLYPFLTIRFVLNVRALVISSRNIVWTEQWKRKTTSQSPR
ncbi:hypothetical protein BWQ96_01029 [Gracilariopsis chorda]|uniref:Uncharacterized protein n=1 Tax=Gracilariopsis chorda TaxID=448386 RepID=A0A2V3J7G9_9FLOR|nr:hypothetical protein BWQ96_01029 [Gracilariopsis chorda]|eukprot:PXF49240.1 hypothetical protein BWQ96_01029 [Gracilariopsis chorda]